MTITNTRYPEIVPYGNPAINIAAIQQFQMNVSNSLDYLDSSVISMTTQLNALGKMLEEADKVVRWLDDHHPEAMREYHATQLALYTLEEPPEPATAP